MTLVLDKATLERELVGLWYRRSRLSQREWTRLYKLVDACLRPLWPTHYNSLLRLHPSLDREELKAELIVDFFTDKVCRPALAPGFADPPLAHCGALIRYYTRYLLDRIAQAERQQATKQSIEAEAAGTGANAAAVGAPSSASDDAGPDDAETAAWTRAAEAFLDAISNEHPWVPTYLGCHFCPDRDQTIPLGRLARAHGIASYHYKAKRLGITWARGGFGSLAAFAETLIGQWVQGLGIAIDPAQLDRVHSALKILCAVALVRVGADGDC